MTNLQRIIIILAAFGAVSIVLSQTGNSSLSLSTSNALPKQPIANVHINSHNQETAIFKGLKESSTKQNEQTSHTIVTNIYQSTSGSFYFSKPFHDSQSSTSQIPEYEVSNLLSTDAKIRITGPIARTSLTQVFSNNTDQVKSGIFVFPLPQDAAVDHLLMRIGDRQIEGEIRPKKEAQNMFVQAKSQGKSASLVAQLRPNMFTNSIANIPPHSEISVTIEYQQYIHQDKHQYSLRLPLSITPRYRSNNTTDLNNADTWVNESAQTEAKLKAKTNISVSLNAGLPINKITSEHHPIITSNPYSTQYNVVLDTLQPANKDFVLNWQMNTGHSIQASHFSYETNDYEYGLITLMPPKTKAIEAKRNVVFVLDVSGSMQGEALDQAKRALAFAINDLQEDDYFNIVTFSSNASQLWHRSEPARAAFKDEAFAFIYALEANGGTEINQALKLAFALPLVQEPNEHHLNQMLFITDGSVHNENELMQTIYQQLGDYRLFTVGIGSAPNAFFMTQAANAGKGTFTFIGDIDHVQSKMARLLEKLKHPALTNIKLNIKDSSNAFGFEVYPSTMPDLYADDPLIITYRRKLADIGHNSPVDVLPFSIQGEYLNPTVNGGLKARQWSSQLPKVNAKEERGIHKYWARLKIKDLEQQFNMRATFSEGSDDIKSNIKKGITKVALDHHLVSKYTSLIAIDHSQFQQQKAQQQRNNENSQKQQRRHYTQATLPSTATASGLLSLVGSLLMLCGGFLILKRT